MNKKIIGALCLAIACTGAVVYSKHYVFNGSTSPNELMMENVEALSGTETGDAKCPSGCKNIGWGTNKILECDCNYDHFSSCESWGGG